MTPKSREIEAPETIYWPERNGYYETKCRVTEIENGEIQINNSCVSLKNAKEIHEWLGRAIAYLESNK